MNSAKRGPVSYLLHGAAHRLLKTKHVGAAISAAANALGLEEQSRRVSRHSHFVPPWVPFRYSSDKSHSFEGKISSANGTDQIARVIWTKGLNAYEAPLPMLFASLARGAGTVLDIGANSGIYALLAALADPRCHIYSFEPFPKALHWLRVNIDANGVADRVTVVESAAGRTDGDADFFLPEENPNHPLETSASLIATFRPRHSAVLRVKVKRLDDFVSERQITNVGLLRADVEGSEHMVLEGAMNLLNEQKPLVFVEVLSDISAGYLENVRSKINYGVLVLNPDKLISLPQVRCTPGDFNQLWYPLEKRDRIDQLSAETGLPIVDG